MLNVTTSYYFYHHHLTSKPGLTFREMLCTFNLKWDLVSNFYILFLIPLNFSIVFSSFWYYIYLFCFLFTMFYLSPHWNVKSMRMRMRILSFLLHLIVSKWRIPGIPQVYSKMNWERNEHCGETRTWSCVFFTVSSIVP